METSELDQLEAFSRPDIAPAEPVTPDDAAEGTSTPPRRRRLLEWLLGPKNSELVTRGELRAEIDIIADQFQELRDLHGTLKAQYMRLRKMEKRIAGTLPPPPEATAEAEGRGATKAELRSLYAQQRMKR